MIFHILLIHVFDHLKSTIFVFIDKVNIQMYFDLNNNSFSYKTFLYLEIYNVKGL